MERKNNEYVILSRRGSSFGSIDVEEFGDCVRGYCNQGYVCIGGLSVTYTPGGQCLMTQAVQYPKRETITDTGVR